MTQKLVQEKDFNRMTKDFTKTYDDLMKDLFLEI